jgi:hypothetical protein
MPDVTLYNWVRRGWLKARQIDGPQGRWVVVADGNERKRLKALRTRRHTWPAAGVVSDTKSETLEAPASDRSRSSKGVR